MGRPSDPGLVAEDYDVAGYEHIEKAADLLKDVVEDLFLLPTEAQERAVAHRAALEKTTATTSSADAGQPLPRPQRFSSSLAGTGTQ
jgi:hypothetical protein